MRGVVLAAKAIFMIFLIVFTTFTVSDLSFVKAEESNACCEKTVSGDSCVYTSQDQCDTNYLVASTSCEQTSYCKPGCCISDVGKCSKSVSKGTCESIEGYSWQDDAACEIDSCKKNCCVIAESQCSYTTEANCEVLISGLEDIVLDWRDVDSESSCTDICNAFDVGCCVAEDSCTFGNQGSCVDKDIDLTTGYGFYKNTYCSDLGNCGCVEHSETKCVGEDVYWFDSCGNQEERANDCDYTKGTWCGTKTGVASCESTDCNVAKGVNPLTGESSYTFDGLYNINLEDETWINRDPHDDRIGAVRENGESWCLYESPVGAFKDFPGSQHYRSYCYFGEEIIEPCADYREEVCIQVPYTSYKGIDQFGIWSTEYNDNDYSGPSGSACVDNVDNAYFNPNTTTVSVGSNWDDSSLVDTCVSANVDCQLSYAKDSWTDPTFQGSQNTQCLYPQWTRAMNEYCRSKGDCGATYNVANEFTNDGFYMSSSQEFLAANDEKNESHRVYVGYDSCVDHYIEDAGTRTYIGKGSGIEEFTNQIASVNNAEQQAVYCLYDCDEDNQNDESTCNLINEISEEDLYSYYDGDFDKYYQKLSTEEGSDLIVKGFPSLTLEEDLASYGVYGGLTALSQIYENSEIGEIKSNSLLVYALSSASVVGSLVYMGYAYSVAVGVVQTGEKITLLTSGSYLSKGTTSAFAVVGGIVAVILTVVNWAIVATTVNPEERQQATQSFAIASSVAAGVTAVALYIATAGAASMNLAGLIVSIAALAVAAVAAIVSYGGEVREVTVSSYCEPWQPPDDGDDCDLCDISVSDGGLAIDDGSGNVLRGYECTEYKCKSLGKNCQYIAENQGSTRPKCIGVETNDVNHPLINEVYIYGDYVSYRDTATEKIGSYGGYEALTLTQKVDPYTYFEFGIETDEPSQCKIGLNDVPPEKYEDLDTYFPDSYFGTLHNQSWILTPDETYNFYVVCKDYVGNGESPANVFVLQFNTSSGDDITPPSIEATSLVNGGYVPYGVNETQLNIYTDEPANCKWSSTDVEYTLMENYFVGLGIPSTASAYFDNECVGLLNVSSEINYYFFACQDAAGNSNTENYPFTLQSTSPLNIDYVYPNGTLYYDYTELLVQTSSGAENGAATCSYDGINFFETNASYHRQPLQDLSAGAYSYDISCVDAAGNINTSVINFNVEVDINGPQLIYLYRSGEVVYYTLSEDSSCEYSFEDFSFGSGTDIAGSFALTELKKYYLKCQDTFGNEGSWVINI